MLQPCVKLLIKTRDVKMYQFIKYEISNVFTPSGIIFLVYNLQTGMILLLTLLTLPEMQIL